MGSWGDSKIDPVGTVLRMDYELICKTAQDLGAELLHGEEIRIGDYYFAHRNGPVKLLRAREVKDGFIVPEEMDYCYDIRECVKANLDLAR